MRRAGAIAFLATFVAGLVVLIVSASGAERSNSFTLGSLPVVLLAPLHFGDRVCQQPIAVPEPIKAVQLVLGPAGEVRGPVRVTVRRPDLGQRQTSTPLAVSTRPRSRITGRQVNFILDKPVAAGQNVAVCVDQSGPEIVEVWGDTPAERTPATSQAYSNGRNLGGDLYMTFPDPAGASLLDRIPAAFRHAAPYKLGDIGAWAFWALLALLVIGAPVALARAINGAARDDRNG